MKSGAVMCSTISMKRADPTYGQGPHAANDKERHAAKWSFHTAVIPYSADAYGPFNLYLLQYWVAVTRSDHACTFASPVIVQTGFKPACLFHHDAVAFHALCPRADSALSLLACFPGR